MGASSSALSAEAEAFSESYAALPDDVHDIVEALCEKDSLALLKAHSGAPPPFPAVPIGVVLQLDHGMASAALAAVPRLQRKHYELIPKSLSELDFFISFFSHLSAIVAANCPGAFDLAEAPEGAWKGVDATQESADDNGFSKAWLTLPDQKKELIAELCAKESGALLTPSPVSPPAFPTLPLGMRCFIDEAAATAALSTVPGLQYKHYTLVPAKLDEAAFWTNFFSHVTEIALA